MNDNGNNNGDAHGFIVAKFCEKSRGLLKFGQEFGRDLRGESFQQRVILVYHNHLPVGGSQGIVEARSPQLSEISAKMPGNADASYKRLQRFLQANEPQATLKMLFNEEADFVIADPTEIERPHANQTKYVCTLMDGETKGFWMLTLATPLRGRAIPFHCCDKLSGAISTFFVSIFTVK